MTINNRLIENLKTQPENNLSIFYTAGFPKLNDTRTILKQLEESGAAMVEIGIPFSDPVADGETIQASNKVALDNGMQLKVLLNQLSGFRDEISIPVLLMGYLNPIVQYGIEQFCKDASALGIDGVILPDLPLDLYLEDYKDLFEKYQLSNIFLITPQTSEERIRLIDDNSQGFIYMVSSNSITGKTNGISEQQEAYFDRIQAMNLKNPIIIGFGISDNKTFSTACNFANGAIIGSAFIRTLEQSGPAGISSFIKTILNPV